MKLKKKVEEISNNASMGILKLICILNGINYNEYIGSVGLFADGILLKDPNFIRMSSVNWLSNQSLPCSNYIFKIKFASLLFSKIMGRDSKISKNVNKYYDLDNKKSKNKMNMDINIDLYNSCYNLTMDILNNRKWSKSIYDINSYIMAIPKKSNYDDIQYHIDYIYNDLVLGTRYEPMTGRLFDNGTVTYELLRLAYLLITYDTDYENFIGGKKFSGLKIDEDMSWFLYKYGKRLNKYITKNKKTISPLFKAFLSANPSCYTNSKFAGNDNIGLAMLSLEFIKFIYDDERLNIFIDRVMNTKLKFGKKLPKENPIDLKRFMNLQFS